jgi:hypothetical protein
MAPLRYPEFCGDFWIFYCNICDSLLSGIVLYNWRKYQVNWRYPVLMLPVVVLLTVVTVQLTFCVLYTYEATEQNKHYTIIVPTKCTSFY